MPVALARLAPVRCAVVAALFAGSAVGCADRHRAPAVGEAATVPSIESSAEPAERGLHDPSDRPAGFTITELRAGPTFTCARSAAGAMRCWGKGPDAAESSALFEQRDPGQLPGGLEDAVSLAPGRLHSCAVLGDGEIRCWGNNTYGQLGNGSDNELRTEPVEVVGIDDATRVAVGISHSCALRRQGTVMCWGGNSAGTLGDGTTRTSNRPVEVVGLDSVKDLTAASSHTCALRRDQTVWCWGDNGLGQLGVREPGFSPRPVQAVVPGPEGEAL